EPEVVVQGGGPVLLDDAAPLRARGDRAPRLRRPLEAARLDVVPQRAHAHHPATLLPGVSPAPPHPMVARWRAAAGPPRSTVAAHRSSTLLRPRVRPARREP